MDTYAQIAKSWSGGRHQLLRQPEPAWITGTHVTLDGVDDTATTVTPKMNTATQLRSAVDAARKDHSPFMQKHAPSLDSLRHTINLREFHWCRQSNNAHRLASLPSWNGLT